MAAPHINDPTKQIGYVATRSGIYVAGKQAAEAFSESFAEPIVEVGKSILPVGITNNLGSIAGFINPNIAGLLTISLAAGVSAGLTQMDYQHKRNNLSAQYQEELKVNNTDLDGLAKKNGIISTDLSRAKKQRLFGLGMSLTATMAALSVVILAVAPALIEAGLTGGLLTGAGAAAVAIKGIAGLATYHAVKDPLHYVADKLYDLDGTTPNDYIVALGRERAAGKAITREQVLSVFVAANPQLDRFIVSEYGGHFDDLPPSRKQQVAQEINKLVPLDKLTFEINTGKVNVTELAFAVQGDISGVYHDKMPQEEPKRGFLGNMWSGMTNALGFSSSKTESTSGVTTTTTTTTVFENEAPAQPFTQRLGLARKDPDLSHVERVNQGRAEQALVAQQQLT